ncbi:MAG: class I SAM-dependent methyltransferase [Candidatus Aegiribacteria sp.]|nr:class I SAM-dependent methyltransferase [Candidatus Aegiribacteria sp.]
MNNKSAKNSLIEKGIRAGEIDMYEEDNTWSQNSSDKVDIAEELMCVIRNFCRTIPVDRLLNALSIGSGSEPQFQILEAAFRGGLNLLDIDSIPLSVIDKRIQNHWIDHVKTIQADYNKVLVHDADARLFLSRELGGTRQDLITLHHSLYYSSESDWAELFGSLYGTVLAEQGAIHAVMMSSDCREPDSTTWLYNHYAGKFFGCRNDQNLASFGKTLHSTTGFEQAEIRIETHRVRFFTDDFEKFMEVIWMILLYPNVHDYTHDQREEITEHVYSSFYEPGKPLIQMQDHLIITR